MSIRDRTTIQIDKETSYNLHRLAIRKNRSKQGQVRQMVADELKKEGMSWEVLWLEEQEETDLSQFKRDDGEIDGNDEPSIVGLAQQMQDKKDNMTSLLTPDDWKTKSKLADRYKSKANRRHARSLSNSYE